MAHLELPKDKRDLAYALDMEIGPADLECNIHKVTWKLIDAYLGGHRHFRVTDRLAGTLEIAFENFDGNLEFRYEKVLRNFLTECGRYSKMQVEPSARRKGETLDSMRKGAIAHAALGSLTKPLDLGFMHREAIKPFLKYGTVGLEAWETGNASRPDAVDIIHPRELRGLPAFVDGCHNLRAVVRKRHVPLSWVRRVLKDRFGKELRGDDQNLRAVDVAWGNQAPGDPTVSTDTFGESSMSLPPGKIGRDSGDDQIGIDVGKPRKRGGPDRMPHEMGRVFVPLEEIYVMTDDLTYLMEYIIKVGEVVPFRELYERKVLMPISVGRHTDTGRFYGRGFVGPQIALNDQIEKMLANYFKNMIDLDLYGSILVPDSWGVDMDNWKAGRRPRIDKYTPDIGAPQAGLESVQPVTSGTLPAQAAQTGIEMLVDQSGQGSIFSGEATGRVDSASGHGFLFDVANTALAMPSHSLADAYVSIYSKLLERGRNRLRDDPDSIIELAVVDDAVAGVVIDGNTGQLRLEDNPIPEPWEVKIDIKDRQPKDTELRKQELLGLYQGQLVDYTRFWLTAYEENLDFPGRPKDLWETYRKAIWQIVMLFRDGETPGQIIAGEHSTNPNVQLMAVQAFMNKIEFSLASREVREAFELWKQTLEAMTGQFPSGLMPPDASAQLQQQMMQQQARQAQPAPGGF